MLVSEYQQMYVNGEFWGFYTLWIDWKGNRWILPYLCKWYYGELPEWLTNEEIGDIDESTTLEN